MKTLEKISGISVRGGLALACCAIAVAVFFAPMADAAPFDLYQAAVPQPDRTEAGLTSAFQNAMRIVLVRVTGRRSAASDPAFAPLVQNARRYMQQYRAAAGNQISVSFDSAAIDRWLSQNGQPLWGRERPITVIWLAVPNAQGAGAVVTREDSSELKRSLDAAASLRGIELRWPSAGEVQADGITYASISGAPGNLTDISRRLGGEGVLVGRASDASANAGVKWTFIFQGHSSEFSGGLEGLNRVADSYANIFAASGGPVPVEFDVAGLSDLRSYANTETYLESLTSIAHLSLIAFEGDTARFRAVARGGADSLRRAVALDGRLEPVGGDDSAGLRFHLRR